MKKKDIWISVGIIVVVLVAFYFYSQRKGYISVDAGGTTATLQLDSGWFHKVTLGAESEPVAVPARVYKGERLHLRKSQNGSTWGVDTRGPWGNLAQIKVKNRQTTFLRVGPPLLIKPTIQRSASNVSIGLSIIGQAGEQYGVRQVTKDVKQPAAPAVKIIDDSGKVLAAGKFAFG